MEKLSCSAPPKQPLVQQRACSRRSPKVRKRRSRFNWCRSKIGDQIGYLALIARAAESAYDDGASIVVLAQASMAGAAGLVKNGPRPLTSPSVGLAEAARIIRD